MLGACAALGDPSGVGVCGGHAYSEDGLAWALSGGGATAYGPTVAFADGAGPALFTRRERPHLIFAREDAAGCGAGVLAPCGEPAALLTGAQFPPADGTFTLLQPLVPFSL